MNDGMKEKMCQRGGLKDMGWKRVLYQNWICIFTQSHFANMHTIYE